MGEPVDWDLALATGVRAAGRGPRIAPVEAAEAVAGLRAAASAAQDPVAQITGLDAGDAPAAVVVDRPEWIKSNADSLRTVISPLADRMQPGPLSAVSTRVNAIEVGVALGWMSGKVLGQYEVLMPPGHEPRLLLVAPNIVAAARQMKVDDADFRLWVCLHEETHRVQFGAVPWLSGFFAESIDLIVRDLDVGPGEFVNRVASALRGPDRGNPMTWLQSSQARERADALMGLMSLVEGHADWVMDQAAGLIPSTPELRAAMEKRRRASGLFDSMMRRLLGLEAKMAQYRDGAAFVRAVVAEVGVADFNTVWAAAENLPTMTEIHEPHLWLARMGGS